MSASADTHALPTAIEATSVAPPVVWMTRFWSQGSSALVSRELVLALAASGHTVRIHNLAPEVRTGLSHIRPHALRALQALEAAPTRLRDACVVRCSRPKPSESLVDGMWQSDIEARHRVTYLTTAYGYLPPGATPEGGLRLMSQIWGCSDFVVDTLRQTGFDRHKLKRVPLGFNPETYNTGVQPESPPTNKKCCFIHVSIPYVSYKGIDLLLRAYTREFTDRDDVCLFLQTRPYRGMERRLAEIVAEERRRARRSPEVVVHDAFVTEEQLARWYAASRCYVQTSRASGFDMPPLSALACGTPVIAVGWGGHMEYCDERTEFILPYALRRRPTLEAEEDVASIPVWAEADVEALQAAMRVVYESPREAAERGAEAARRVVRTHTWRHAASAARAALHELSMAG
jgi:glycosyltransferase involved in cell wall biosynthesis